MAAALTLPVGISLGIVRLEPLGSHFASLGMSWEEEDWIDEEATSGRGPDD